MRHRKTAVVKQDDLLESANMPARRTKTAIAVRPKDLKEIVAEEAAKPGASIEVLMLKAKFDFHNAMVEMELPSISKDNKITLRGGSFRVASFENIHDTVMHLLRKRGLRMTFLELPQTNPAFVTMRCICSNGIYEEVSDVTMPTAAASPAMSPQQAKASAMSFACRHGTIRLLNLNSHAPEDKDVEPQKPSNEKIVSDEQYAKMVQSIALNKVPEKMVVDKYVIPHCQGDSIDALKTLPERLYQQFMNACTSWGERHK